MPDKKPAITPVKPPLKWAGGKRWLVKHIKPLWQQYSDRRLVEPLCGGLAVAFGLMPERALLNDVNAHSMNFFKWLKRGLVINIPMLNDKELYYKYRELFNTIIKNGQACSIVAAQLFYYLNRTGYNGLCRFNSRDEFNVPFGRYKNINYTRDFTCYREVFKNWDLSVTDFEAITPDPADFIYADPPYDVDFTQYARGGFAWEDQVRLARWLAQHPGPVVLSNQATGRIIDLYTELEFKISYLNGPRMINCTGNRTPAREVLATKGFKEASPWHTAKF
ncbi:MAG: Dam family site-specific DNA-(adenine-N6)-methyltransferase [Bacillota bacterium]